MKMKRLPQITLMLLAVFAAFTSCKKDEDFKGIESTEFRINYPDGFSSSARFEGEVKTAIPVRSIQPRRKTA